MVHRAVFRQASHPARRPDGYAIRRKKRFDLLSRGICNPPIPSICWLLPGGGIANPQSIKRLGHFLTADNISAGTPNGGQAYPAQRKGHIQRYGIIIFRPTSIQQILGRTRPHYNPILSTFGY